MRDNNELLIEAAHEASKSTCLSKRVGALIVLGDEVIAKGFNDTLQGATCGAGGCLRCQLRAAGAIRSGESRSTCLCIHAEINAITKLEKSRRLFNKKDSRMFVTIPPCLPCAKAIIQVGVSKVYYSAPDHDGAGILYLRGHGAQAVGLN